MQVIKHLEEVRVASAIHPRRRILLLQRNDGNLTFAEQYRYFSELEGDVIAKGWATLPATGTYATAELAEADGRAEMARWPRQGT